MGHDEAIENNFSMTFSDVSKQQKNVPIFVKPYNKKYNEQNVHENMIQMAK